MLILQLTGLSGVGKSTLANALKVELHKKNISAEVIDADVYRATLNKDLRFSAADRRENIRRLALVAEGFRQQGTLALLAAINPYEDIRQEVKTKFGARTVWLTSDLDLLIKRDTKGLYRRALLPDAHPDKLHNLTGINDPYETPVLPDLVIDTGRTTVEEATQQLLQYTLLQCRQLMPAVS